MDIERLKTFLAVEEFGGLRKAAEFLHITPSAVSARIRQIEQEMGIQLFERDKKGLFLTPAGQCLKKGADNLIQQWKQLQHDVIQSKQETVVLHIGAPDVVWRTSLLQKVKMLQRTHTHLRFSLKSTGRSELAQMLISGELDCAILPEEIKYPGITSHPTGDLELLLVRSPRSIQPKESSSDSYIDVDWGGIVFQHIDPKGSNHPMTLADVNVAWLGLDWLLQVGGTAWLPQRLVQRHLESGALERVEERAGISLPLFACISKEKREVNRWLTSLYRSAPQVETDES